MTRTGFSLVIPVYNEVDNVEPLVHEILAAVPATQNLEIVFVDDGSTDGTRAALQALAKNQPCVRVVFHKKNYGQSTSLVTGIRAAQYPWIITLDGDRQNDPQDLPQIMAAINPDEKMIAIGIRAKRQDSWLKRISSRIANGVRRRLLKDDCPDTGCSLKCFPREAFLALPLFNHIHRYLPALFKRAGFRTVQIKVNHRPRVAGTSKYGVMNRLFVGIVDLVGVMWLIRRPCTSEVTHDAS